MTKEEVTEKIRKLLALSYSPVEAEAKLALAKARELMMKWTVEEYELQNGQKTEFVEITLFKGEKRPFKIKLITSILQSYFNVKTLTYNERYKKRIICFGTRSSTEFAVYVFSYLSEIFDSLWSQNRVLFNLNETYKKRYFMGLAEGFMDYLKSQIRHAQEEIGTALMVIGKELEVNYNKQHPNICHQPINVSARDRVDRAIYNKGIIDGRKIRVKRSVSSTKKDLLENG